MTKVQEGLIMPVNQLLTEEALNDISPRQVIWAKYIILSHAGKNNKTADERLLFTELLLLLYRREINLSQSLEDIYMVNKLLQLWLINFYNDYTKTL